MKRLLWPQTVLGPLGTGLRFRHCSAFTEHSLGTWLRGQQRERDINPVVTLSNPSILTARQVFKQKEEPEAQGCVPGVKGEPVGSGLGGGGEHGQKGTPEGSWAAGGGG